MNVISLPMHVISSDITCTQLASITVLIIISHFCKIYCYLSALKVSYERDNRSIDEIKQLIKEAESCKEDEMKCIANSTNSSVQQVIDSIQQPHELSELFHKYKSLLK